MDDSFCMMVIIENAYIRPGWKVSLQCSVSAVGGESYGCVLNTRLRRTMHMIHKSMFNIQCRLASKAIKPPRRLDCLMTYLHDHLHIHLPYIHTLWNVCASHLSLIRSSRSTNVIPKCRRAQNKLHWMVIGRQQTNSSWTSQKSKRRDILLGPGL